jgi:hypothetical protein
MSGKLNWERARPKRETESIGDDLRQYAPLLRKVARRHPPRLAKADLRQLGQQLLAEWKSRNK